VTEKQKDAVAYIIDTIVNPDDGADEESDKDSDVKHKGIRPVQAALRRDRQRLWR